VDGPRPWLATAYVPGPPLADAVRDHGPLPPVPVFALAAGLAESLAAIHAADVVHRHLKPSNILLADDGAPGDRLRPLPGRRRQRPDNRRPDHRLTRVPVPRTSRRRRGRAAQRHLQLRSGTRLRGNRPQPLGTGSTPALVYRVVHAAPALDGIPTEVRDLTNRCLAKNPDHRPTAADVLAELSDADITAGWLPAATTRPISAENHSDSLPHPETIQPPRRREAPPLSVGPGPKPDKHQPSSPRETPDLSARNRETGEASIPQSLGYRFAYNGAWLTTCGPIVSDPAR
jgi:serine/threonine protein kinase